MARRQKQRSPQKNSREAPGASTFGSDPPWVNTQTTTVVVGRGADGNPPVADTANDKPLFAGAKLFITLLAMSFTAGGVATTELLPRIKAYVTSRSGDQHEHRKEESAKQLPKPKPPRIADKAVAKLTAQLKEEATVHKAEIEELRRQQAAQALEHQKEVTALREEQSKFFLQEWRRTQEEAQASRQEAEELQKQLAERDARVAEAEAALKAQNREDARTVDVTPPPLPLEQQKTPPSSTGDEPANPPEPDEEPTPEPEITSPAISEG